MPNFGTNAAHAVSPPHGRPLTADPSQQLATDLLNGLNPSLASGDRVEPRSGTSRAAAYRRPRSCGLTASGRALAEMASGGTCGHGATLDAQLRYDRPASDRCVLRERAPVCGRAVGMATLAVLPSSSWTAGARHRLLRVPEGTTQNRMHLDIRVAVCVAIRVGVQPNHCPHPQVVVPPPSLSAVSSPADVRCSWQ